MAGQQPDDPRQRVARGPTGACQQALARLENARDVAPAPSIGHREGRDLAARGDEQLDLALANGFAVRPGRELLDFARELVEIVSDEARSPS
ncbi:MAG: hypothetical protein AUG88_02585 [Actinobacteria bacterium 13_1_20CM_4_68_12]|nr:MAG: hypothetical protein AUG88_02585 [Actinobacteria bacterium 13_1_20CM_4_68_12]